MERSLQNILLEEKGERLTYIPINGGRGESNFPVRASRQGHASYLKKQLESAWNSALDETKNVVATSVRDGVYLQIEGKAGYDLITKSLEDTRQHVRLLNVSEENGVTRATVYVPTKKQDFFLKKINKYAETQSGSDVVTTIEKINTAMVESLWVGKKEFIPNEISVWCEVWLRYEVNEQPKAIVDAFWALCAGLEIEYKEKMITFPERIIVLIKANIENLKQLMLVSGNLAEIRRMITPASFYTDMTAWEQKEWVAELEKRLDVSKRSNTSVCLLDTGVNNAHPLLKTVLKDTDMHTVDVARGVDDRRGHGTEMAGIATYFDLQEKLESMSVVEVYHYLESVKILNNSNDNDEELYGAITQQAAYIAETENPFDSILTDEQIAYLAMAVNDVKMFNVSLSADELKAIFACKPEAIVRSNNNRLVAFFFFGLSSRGLITPNWQSVIANHKLFLSKDTSRDKYINQSDLSTATNYIRDVGVEGKYATLEKYLMQVKRL